MFDGTTQRGGGETCTVDTATAEAWLAADWVERVDTKAKATKARAKAGD